jgi:hypothetical protein
MKELFHLKLYPVNPVYPACPQGIKKMNLLNEPKMSSRTPIRDPGSKIQNEPKPIFLCSWVLGISYKQTQL